MKILSTISPQEVWTEFETICSIPHPSKHEQKLAEHIYSIGIRLGLETIQDNAGNILIRKPASTGMENRPSVVLQAHIDMVPQKNSDYDHNFLTDSISLRIEDEWVTADNTTLGADNGLGVASMLALLKSDTHKHGPLEFLFTVEEETGMDGAFALEPNILQSNYMLNLDSEDDKEIIIGCAGGIDATVSGSLQQIQTAILEPIQATISVKGLKGGHSGIDIHLGRGNANIILAELLQDLLQTASIDLVSFSGGNMRNAIPREAFATILIAKEHIEQLGGNLLAWQNNLQNTYKVAESAITLELSISGPANSNMVFSKPDSVDFCKAISGAPNGIISFEPEFPDVVQTSTNLSIAELQQNKITLCLLLRSSCNDAKTDLAESIRDHFEEFHLSTHFDGEYPGWAPAPHSKIISILEKNYIARMNRKPEIKIIHAGLECGIIGSKYPELEMVSFGPTIKHPHSPDEKVNIESVGKFWDILTSTIASIVS